MLIPSHFPSEPALLWKNFHSLTMIPRPSKQEDKVREFILEKAKSLNLTAKTDGVGNVIVYVPGSSGRENEPGVIIQNHMDMVTDALIDHKINFLKDPILTKRDGDWLMACGTTLGADNGIGCAAAIALMEDQNVSHPPLELLFTVDEETGLKGAWGIEPSFFKSKRMLNLDTEEWGSVYIGCAGGIDYDFNQDFSLVTPRLSQRVKLKVGQFMGGHSGVDIHEQRGNAIKFLAEILQEIGANNFELEELRGGKAHNIIPRDAFCIIYLNNIEYAQKCAQTVHERWMTFLPKKDLNFKFEWEELEGRYEVIGLEDLSRTLGFLCAFPHGAHRFDINGDSKLVSLSDNLAISLMVKGKFYLLSSLRFFDRGECVGLENQIQHLAKAYKFNFQKNGEYPSWKPIRENKLLDILCEQYEKNFKIKPKITAIHAGLECGILRDKIGPIDAVSFGPTIVNAHSPEEKVNIPSVKNFWTLLVEVLKNI